MNKVPHVTSTADGPQLGLHASYYTDANIFAQEKDKIFYKTWQYACHQSQVRQRGDYFTFQIADQNLFILRDNKDELRCFYNVCMHRGHELLEGSGNKKDIVCPYHAWRYQLNGQLLFARNSENVPGFDRNKICLTSVRLEVFCGFIFINLDNDAKPMDQWFGGAREDLRSAVPDIETYQPIWEHSMEEKCNWKIALENYNECYHCRTVHPQLTQSVIAPETIDIQPRDYTLRHTGSAVSSDQACYDFDTADSEYYVFFLWPNFSIQVYPGRIVNTYWWRYHELAYTTVFRGWLAPNGNQDEATLRIAKIDKETTFVEDLTVIESVQRGLASRGYITGPLVLDPGGGIDNEVSTWSLHRWVREALERN